MGKPEDFTAIILAAGQGTRMKSPLPKVLHPVAGAPMLHRVVQEIKAAGAKEVRVVVGHGENLVRQVIEPLEAVCFKQESQNGTADAVASAKPDDISGPVLILNGDHPLLTAQDIKNIIKEFVNSDSELSIVTAKLKQPGHFGRIVRYHGKPKAIVEVKDASADTKKINEVNTGIYIVSPKLLNKYLPQIENHNAQNEYYFTDILSLAVEAGESVSAIVAPKHVAFGVNTQAELAKATSFIFKRKCRQLMEDGVVIIDPNHTYIEDDVSVGQATVIYPGAYLRAGSKIGSFCMLEPNVYMVKATVGDSVHILAGSHIEDVQIAEKCSIGPYARLRPGTKIASEAKVGNFVEMKKVEFGSKSKAGHLTYLGDAIIGENTNIGCGTITCNYAADKKKYVTKIGDNSFIGSDTQFVAPVEVGSNVVVASGSTITKSIPDGALAVARGKQYIKENYKAKSPDKKES